MSAYVDDIFESFRSLVFRNEWLLLSEPLKAHAEELESRFKLFNRIGLCQEVAVGSNLWT